jgi:excisionase family DNA binding protein
MPTPVPITSVPNAKMPPRPYDPLEPLAQAIGLVLAGGVAKKQASTTVSSKVAYALHQLLDATTPQSRNTRLLLIRHLVDIESQAAGIEIPKTLAVANDLISTAQAAELLGYSRPYVAMLIDQNKLKGATVSSGGHRRVSRATVLAWKDKHQAAGKTKCEATGKANDLRASGQKIGAYKSTEADVLRRVKVLASSR